MYTMGLKILTVSKIRKIITSGTLNDREIICVMLSKVVPLPEGGIHKDALPMKLVIARLVKNMTWHWCSLPNSVRNLIIKKRLNKLDKYVYYEIIRTEPHPLEVAKSYLVKLQNYEAASILSGIMKKEKEHKPKDEPVHSMSVTVKTEVKTGIELYEGLWEKK